MRNYIVGLIFLGMSSSFALAGSVFKCIDFYSFSVSNEKYYNFFDRFFWCF